MSGRLEPGRSAHPAPAVRIAGLDHVVLTVHDLAATVDFYERVVGMRATRFAGGDRVALRFGRQKLNLHEVGSEYLPNAAEARPGSADLCLIAETPLDQVVDHLRAHGIAVEEGPSDADGAEGPLRSVWFRDPEGNLVEVANRTSEGGPDGSRVRQVVWSGLDAWRAETATIVLGPDSLRATGTQIGLDPVPYRLDYELETDGDWITRRLGVLATGAGWTRELDLRRRPDGVWSADATETGAAPLPPPGGEVASLAGALDCDLGLCPLTNTMPVRRHRLHVHAGGEDLLVAWVSVPDLGVHAARQRYEHVGRRDGGAAVRYVDPDVTAELELDDDGLVALYPNLAQRVG